MATRNLQSACVSHIPFVLGSAGLSPWKAVVVFRTSFQVSFWEFTSYWIKEKGGGARQLPPFSVLTLQRWEVCSAGRRVLGAQNHQRGRICSWADEEAHTNWLISLRWFVTVLSCLQRNFCAGLGGFCWLLVLWFPRGQWGNRSPPILFPLSLKKNRKGRRRVWWVCAETSFCSVRGVWICVIFKSKD